MRTGIDDPGKAGTHYPERLDHHHAECVGRLPAFWARRLAHRLSRLGPLPIVPQSRVG